MQLDNYNRPPSSRLQMQDGVVVRGFFTFKTVVITAMGQERTAQGTGTAPFFIGFYIFVTRKKVVLI
jgi:hypothetical protein